jgi:hypothetical protein
MSLQRIFSPTLVAVMHLAPHCIVENQAQHRQTVTVVAAVGRIRVNGIRPVGTDGGRAVGQIGENRIRPVVLDSRMSAN